MNTCYGEAWCLLLLLLVLWYRAQCIIIFTFCVSRGVGSFWLFRTFGPTLRSRIFASCRAIAIDLVVALASLWAKALRYSIFQKTKMIIMNASNEHLIPCDPHNYFEMTYHFESFHCIFCCNFHPSFRMLRLFLPSFFCSLLRTDANQIIFSTFQILLFLCLRLLQNTIKK